MYLIKPTSKIITWVFCIYNEGEAITGLQKCVGDMQSITPVPATDSI